MPRRAGASRVRKLARARAGRGDWVGRESAVLEAGGRAGGRAERCWPHVVTSSGSNATPTMGAGPTFAGSARQPARAAEAPPLPGEPEPEPEPEPSSPVSCTCTLSVIRLGARGSPLMSIARVEHTTGESGLFKRHPVWCGHMIHSCADMTAQCVTAEHTPRLDVEKVAANGRAVVQCKMLYMKLHKIKFHMPTVSYRVA